MSFGYRDEDWVDPDPAKVVRCNDCEYWLECPCGCGNGWCTDFSEFTSRDDECEVDG